MAAVRIVSWILIVGLFACGKKSANQGDVAASAALKPAQPQTLALEPQAERPDVPVTSLRGVLTLKKGQKLAELSARPVFGETTVGQKPSSWPEQCSVLSERDFRPLTAEKGARLGQVLVSVTGFKTAPSHTPQRRVLGIEDCRLTPRFLVAVRGDTLVLENHSNFPFLPKLRGDSFLQAIINGSSRELLLEDVGVQKISCAFAAPCGSTDLVVLGHPVFALSDAQGRFEIKNLPTIAEGEQVMLHAWHPLLRQEKLVLSHKTDLSSVLTIEMSAASLRQPSTEPDKSGKKKP